MTTLQVLSDSQVSKEVPINENTETLSHGGIFGKRHPVTTGLTWGYYGGLWRSATIANGTVTLTASQTNYVVVNRSTGAVSVSTATTNWDDTAAYARLYKITTGVAAVTAVEDHRAGWLWSAPAESVTAEAANVSVEDTAGNFAATNVEDALAELADDIDAISGVTDGDKGDITVSASGATWTIDAGAVTYAKMQDVSATSRVLGRKTAGAGDPEELTLSELLDFIGSAAQGDILYRGAAGWARLAAGTSGHYLQTQGAAANPQWAAASGGSLSDGDYGDVTVSSSGTVITIDNDAVTNAKLANMATQTIKGRTTGGSGDPEDLTAAQAAAIVQGDGLTVDLAGFRGVPQNAQTGNYTLVAADAGKHIYHDSSAGAGDTYTIPANGSVAFPVGTTVTFVNDDSNAVSIAITTDTLVLAGTGTTGTRTLAQYGVATAIKVTSTRWIISGTGLT
jgi:hypothetical protein